jgi:hypothetical protein
MANRRDVYLNLVVGHRKSRVDTEPVLALGSFHTERHPLS